MTAFARSFSVWGTDEEMMAVRLANDIRHHAKQNPIKGVFFFAGVGFDIPRFHSKLLMQLPTVPMIGTTSCLGTGSDNGYHPAPCVTALAFFGNGFRLSTGFVSRQGSEPRSQGRKLAEKALAQGKMTTDKVRFAMLFCSHGDEQELLDGIYDVLPKEMPILGGGAADNDLSGNWYVWNEFDRERTGAVLAVCDWPWELAANFESGYLVAGPTGQASSVENRRILKTIDGKPAAEVYNEWVKGAIDHKMNGGSILNETTLNPLGIAKKVEGGFRTFILIHPEAVLPDKSIKLFASIDEGETLHLMFTRQDSLLNKTQRLAKKGYGNISFEADDIVASIFIYCGGCRFAIQGREEEMIANFRKTSSAPFIAGFTFGEVGCVLPLMYGHGNLMAGSLILSNKEIASHSDQTVFGA